MSKISKNPFESHHLYRYKLVWDLIPDTKQTVLDYGAGTGDFLLGLMKKKSIMKLMALEVDKEKLRSISKHKSLKRVKMKMDKVELKNNSVDIVTMLDVLEHVPGEKLVLSEVWRVLKPGGKLILSVPNHGFTEVLDPGNIKFRFPALHRFLYRHILKKTDYTQKFGSGELFGDVSFQKIMWHRHYNLSQLTKLLGSRFNIVRVVYYGMFHTLLSALLEVSQSLFQREPGFLKKMYLLDTRTSFGRFSYSILIEALKS